MLTEKTCLRREDRFVLDVVHFTSGSRKVQTDIAAIIAYLTQGSGRQNERVRGLTLSQRDLQAWVYELTGIDRCDVQARSLFVRFLRMVLCFNYCKHDPTILTDKHDKHDPTVSADHFPDYDPDGNWVKGLGGDSGHTVKDMMLHQCTAAFEAMGQSFMASPDFLADIAGLTVPTAWTGPSAKAGRMCTFASKHKVCTSVQADAWLTIAQASSISHQQSVCAWRASPACWR